MCETVPVHHEEEAIQLTEEEQAQKEEVLL